MNVHVSDTLFIHDLLPKAAEALAIAENFTDQARQSVAAMVSKDGKVSAGLLEQEQLAVNLGVEEVKTPVHMTRTQNMLRMGGIGGQHASTRGRGDLGSRPAEYCAANVACVSAVCSAPD